MVNNFHQHFHCQMETHLLNFQINQVGIEENQIILDLLNLLDYHMFQTNIFLYLAPALPYYENIRQQFMLLFYYFIYLSIMVWGTIQNRNAHDQVTLYYLIPM
jgi:hypothetical protein